jgi:hypothetical protein
MSKIYVITTGDYDYSILNVLSTHELAEEFKAYYDKLSRYSSNDIEEYELDQWLPQFREGLKQFWVMIDVEGNVNDCQLTGGIETWRSEVTIRNILRHEYVKEMPEWEEVKKDIDKYYMPGLFVVCWAKDKRHAIKIANEKRTMLIAQNLIPPARDIEKFQHEQGFWNTVEDFWHWKNGVS